MSVEQLGNIEIKKQNKLALENGFESIEKMNEAHQPIVAMALEAIPRDGGKVLDLGCGNGMLLKSLHAKNKEIIPYGIEYNKEVVDSAREVQSNFANNFLQGNLFESQEILPNESRFDLVVLMIGRLSEVKDRRVADNFLQWLRMATDTIIVYSYNDWLDEHKSGLKYVLDKTGLEIIKYDKENAVALLGKNEV